MPDTDNPAPPVAGATRRTVARDGVELSVLDAGEGFPVVLAHGFPELAYSWRHQIPALAAAGCRVLAPDQRGYGRSSRPAALEDYDILRLTGDLVGLLDDIGEERAVFVGHDWGAMLVWHLALLAPERVAGVVGMSVPFLPRGPIPPTQLMRQVVGDSFLYILYFQEPGVADADLGRDAAETMTRMLAGLRVEAGDSPVPPDALAGDGRGFVERLPEAEGLPGWLGQDELDHYIDEFRRTGFTGGLNWYRNMDRNWELTPQLAGAKVAEPALFVGGSSDPVLLMTPPAVMDGWLDDPRGTVLVDGAGHWVQQEKPAEVNAALIDFVDAVRTGT
ncbi:MAG TPA: alpha/beta hydrolase [Acidimicrobiales bacterium]|nr:alpha/beta hydrolase [Acidimicrobiales bacterium]